MARAGAPRLAAPTRLRLAGRPDRRPAARCLPTERKEGQAIVGGVAGFEGRACKRGACWVPAQLVAEEHRVQWGAALEVDAQLVGVGRWIRQLAADFGAGAGASHATH